MSTQIYGWEYLVSLVENATLNRSALGAPHNAKITLELDSYEASNLLWHLKQLWFGKIPCNNPGDWYGQVPSQLERKMKEAGGTFVTTSPNGGGDPFAWP